MTHGTRAGRRSRCGDWSRSRGHARAGRPCPRNARRQPCRPSRRSPLPVYAGDKRPVRADVGVAGQPADAPCFGKRVRGPDDHLARYTSPVGSSIRTARVGRHRGEARAGVAGWATSPKSQSAVSAGRWRWSFWMCCSSACTAGFTSATGGVVLRVVRPFRCVQSFRGISHDLAGQHGADPARRTLRGDRGARSSLDSHPRRSPLPGPAARWLAGPVSPPGWSFR